MIIHMNIQSYAQLQLCGTYIILIVTFIVEEEEKKKEKTGSATPNEPVIPPMVQNTEPTNRPAVRICVV